MKIIWIMPRPLSGLYENKVSSSGSWIDAAYLSCRNNDTFEFHVISFDNNIDTIKIYTDGRHKGYVVPYNKMAQHLHSLKSQIGPDIVQLWGTEHDYMLTAAEVFNDVPKLAYIQGVARNIAKNYMAGISFWSGIRNLSIKDIIRRTWIGARQKSMYKTAKIESQVLKSCQGAIVENNWCEDQIKSIAPDIQRYKSKLPLKDVFFNYHWVQEQATPHAIFTNAGGYPIKGHHTLFEALKYVIEKYPDTIIYIPGYSRLGSGFKNWSRRSTYENMLARMAHQFGIEKNIRYIGILNSEQMAQKLTECSVFALPSWVENHSSSLLEAMVVGVPCAASVAGGAITTIINGVNGLTHNPQDAECLAGNIIRIFENPELANRLSIEARKQHQLRQVDLNSDFTSIYSHIIKK